MNLAIFSPKQLDDGSFGAFHSMNKDSSITTEKFLRRCMFLGVDKSNLVLSKTLTYIKRCLNREIEIPDRKEKVIQWNNFEDLMFASWLSIFNDLNDKALTILNNWVYLIESSVVDERFDYDIYSKNYQQVFGKLKPNQRVISPSNFYVVTLVKNKLSQHASRGYFEYIMDKGIYYIYNNSLRVIPDKFDNKNTVFYLYAISLISTYSPEDFNLANIKKWILDHQSEDGYWYLNNVKADGIIFPFQKNWKIVESKRYDIKKFMSDILTSLPCIYKLS